MPKAGYCAGCKRKVLLTEDGSCQIGHHRMHVRNVFEAQPGEIATTSEYQPDENTSGLGKLSVVPPEIMRWNWGALFFGPLWAAAQRIYWPLVVAILLFPFSGIVGPILAIILALKGNEWAWRKRKWESIEQFKRTHQIWANWGIGLLIFMVVVGGLLSTR